MPTVILCDVFTDRPLAGNPLAVILDAETLSDDAVLALAREFGWSEITTVSPSSSAAARVRIWTPSGELPFAGHPTVGTAVVLAAEGKTGIGEATLELGVGPVTVEVSEADDRGGRATMTQGRPEFGPVLDDRAGVAAALGLDPDDLVDDLPMQAVSTGLPHCLVPVSSLDALERVRPVESECIPRWEDGHPRWAYVFTTETPGTNAAARTRLVAPGMEDAATGSAAGPLGAYLVRYGLHRPGILRIEQGVEMGRPSVIEVEVVRESGEIEAVRVSGTVRIWGRGTIEL